MLDDGFYCYLIKSIKTPTSNATYIGFSTDPINRLRQHNGEISAGAWKTSKYRPWIHIVVVSGFPSKITALQFEWHWQHPEKSRIVREAKGNSNDNKKKQYGYRSKLKTLLMLLKTRLWSQLNLSLLFSNEHLLSEFNNLLCSGEIIKAAILEKSSLANVVTTNLKSNLPLVCSYCNKRILHGCRYWTCMACYNLVHITCLAKNYESSISKTSSNITSHNVSDVGNDFSIIPMRGKCCVCECQQTWSEIVRCCTVAVTEEVTSSATNIVKSDVVIHQSTNIMIDNYNCSHSLEIGIDISGSDDESESDSNSVMSAS